MLELLSGSVDGPSVDLRLFYSGCGTESQVSPPFALLVLPVSPANHRRNQTRSLADKQLAGPLCSTAHPPTASISAWYLPRRGTIFLSGFSLNLVRGEIQSRLFLITHFIVRVTRSPACLQPLPCHLPWGGPLHCPRVIPAWRMVEL